LAVDWEVGVTLFHSLGIVAYSGVSAAAPGMVLMNPTSVSAASGTVSLGTNGQVTFTSADGISLNGVFTSEFDNYVISIRSVAAGDGYELNVRLRASGTDSTTGYTRQQLIADGTTVSGLRVSTTSFRIGYSDDTYRSGSEAYIYGPYLAQPTAARNINVSGFSNAWIADYASTHSASTSYDGFTITVGVTLTGALQVYGIRS
jgi:hypothetical protein